MAKKPAEKIEPVELHSRARDLFLQKANLLKSEGVEVVAWHDASLPRFRALDSAKQIEVIEDLKDAVDLLQSAKLDNVSPFDNRQMLWRALKRSGWVPMDDVFDYIDETDTVEVYGLDQRQRFRNLQFFRFVSYTLEEIHTRPWYELTVRNQNIEAELRKAAEKIIAGEIKSTLSMTHIPVHLTHEVDSQQMRSFTIQMKCLSPILHEGKLQGLIAVNHTEFV